MKATKIAAAQSTAVLALFILPTKEATDKNPAIIAALKTGADAPAIIAKAGITKSIPVVLLEKENGLKTYAKNSIKI